MSFLFFDLFAKEIRFKFLREDKYSTCIGGCLSIVMFVVLCILLYFNILAFFDKETVQVYSSSEPFEGSKITALDPKTGRNSEKTPIPEEKQRSEGYFHFAYYITESNGILATPTPIDPSYLKISVNQVTEDSNQAVTASQPITIVDCPDKLGDTFTVLNERYAINEANCIDSEFDVERNSDNGTETFLELRVDRCEGSNCKSKAQIDQYIEDKSLVFFYQNLNFNFTNYENPVYPTLHRQYYSLTKESFNKVDIYLTINEINSKFNYLPKSLFSNNEVFLISKVANTRNRVYNADESKLASLNIKLNNSKTVYDRFLNDLVVSVALVGGITAFFFGIGHCFVYNYSKYRAERAAIEKFLNVKDPECPVFNKGFDEYCSDIYNKEIEEYLQSDAFKGIKTDKFESEGDESKDQGEIEVEENKEVKSNKEALVPEMFFDLDSEQISNDSVVNDSKLSERQVELEMVNVSIASQPNRAVEEESSLSEVSAKQNNIKTHQQLKTEESPQNWLSLKEIEEIFNITEESRNRFLKTFKPRKGESINYLRLLSGKREPDYLLKIKFEMAYQIFKQSNGKKIDLTFWDFIKKDWDKQKSSDFGEDSEETDASQDKSNTRLFRTAVDYLSYKMNLPEMLTSIDKFQLFKQAIFSESQETIFNSMCSPVVKLDQYKSKEAKEKRKTVILLKMMDEILKHRQLSRMETSLLSSLAFPPRLIKELDIQLIEKNKVI